ncbi:hypothetical protein [Aeromonas media]|uniref:hypothetical protein n=1 Tax=Aeromonas media TaxID=651 RepID=UPI003D25F401
MEVKQTVPTKEMIDELKADWMQDPCWDIEDTAGFEAVREELAAWSAEYCAERERQWEEKRKKEEDALRAEFESKGITLFDLYRQLKFSFEEIDSLRERITELEGQIKG